MKLLTLNCHSWQEENQVEKIKYLASVIKKKQYDVVTLQEVSQSINSSYVNSIIKKGEIAGWEAQHQDKRLDLILTNKDIKIEKSNVIFNNINKQIISDQYGVEVFIEAK